MRTVLRGTRPVGTATMDNTSDQPPLALRPRDAARRLGISPRTLWEWTRAGIIPCVRIGSGRRKVVLYSVAELQSWLTLQAQTAKGGEHDPR